MKLATLALLLGIVGACSGAPIPPPQPTPGPDQGTGGSSPIPSGNVTCEQMCAHLAALSCPDGQDQPQCVRLCFTATTDVRFSPTPDDAQRFLNCRFNAQTPADAQICGPASCR